MTGTALAAARSAPRAQAAGLLFDRAASLYLEYLELEGFSPRTLGNKRHELGLFARFLEDRGVEDASAVTHREIAAYQSHIYYEPGARGTRLATSSQRQKLAIVSAFYRWLASEDLILVDPTEEVELPKEPKRLPRDIIEPKEFRRLCKRCDLSTVYGYRDRVIWEVFYSTGMRTSELIGLDVPDVRAAEGFLNVRGKGAKDRTIPLTESCRKYLAVYVADVRPHLDRYRTEILFPTKGGRRFDISALDLNLERYAERAKLRKHVSTRSFRHTFATLMLRGGANIRQIQELLGHESLATTQLYTQVVKQDLKRVHSETHPRERTRADNIRFEGNVPSPEKTP